MKRLSLLFALIFILSGCFDIYEFNVKNDNITLVVEGYISDKSYNDTRKYPSDGRFFSVKLKWANSVTNAHDQIASNALVKLLDSEGDITYYTELLDIPGTYVILDTTFSALSQRRYRLQIALSNGDVFESDWEQMAHLAVPQIGKVCFEEVDKKVYRWESGKKDVVIENGINICINLPSNQNNESLNYRWSFSPMWLYTAPLSSIRDYGHKCWITNDLYLKSYALQADENGGYKNKLLYMSLFRNERVFDKLPILIIQQVLTKDYYRFWEEMKVQSLRGGLFDGDPYNLETNIRKNGEENSKVSGYFGVVKEQAIRWYFSRKELLYYVEDYLHADCLVYYGPDPKAPECYSCLDYPKGQATIFQPDWWEQ